MLRVSSPGVKISISTKVDIATLCSQPSIYASHKVYLLIPSDKVYLLIPSDMLGLSLVLT